jgi:amidohydrolase
MLPQNFSSQSFLIEAQNLFPYTQRLRRDFHRFPELGFQETRTSGIVAHELKSFGLQPCTGIAGTGVAAVINGAHPGPVVMLRFDMDALPIVEETGVEYTSQNPSVMHACGHDGHVAVGLTVAKLLVGIRARLSGSVKLVFQPAEEGLGGAERMIADGVLTNPRPDIALGMHIWNEKPLGWFGLNPGPIMAAGDIFKIEVFGKGGHAAQPHLAVDPVVASAEIIIGLQNIVSRNVSPLETAVVSVTMIHAGEAFNVIPPQVSMQGTIRTFEPVVREMVLERFMQIVSRSAKAFDCQVKIELRSLTPAVINDPNITDRILKKIQQILPESQIDRQFCSMVSEDMAFFLQEIPGCFLFVGSANAEQGLNAPHHHPTFNFDEQALPRAVAILTEAVIDLMERTETHDG